MGGKCSGKVAMGKILCGDTGRLHQALHHGEGRCFGVKILIDIGLGEIERTAGCGFFRMGINRTILVFVRQIDDPW